MTTIPLKVWIKTALDDSNNNISTYLSNSLRIAVALAEQVCCAEEFGAGRTELNATRYSLPPPFPSSCVDWADCVSVTLRPEVGADHTNEHIDGESFTQPLQFDSPQDHRKLGASSLGNNSLTNSLASSQSDEFEDLLSKIAADIGEEVEVGQDIIADAEVDLVGRREEVLVENEGYASSILSAQIHYNLSGITHDVCGNSSTALDPRENSQRIYSLGLVFYELFSGGELPPSELLVVSNSDGGFTAISNGENSVENDGCEGTGNGGFSGDFARGLTIGKSFGNDMEQYYGSNSSLDDGYANGYSRTGSKRQLLSPHPRQLRAVISNISTTYLQLKGVPSSVCDLIVNMIDSINGSYIGNDTYSEMADVVQDLRLMLHKPTIYFHDLDLDKLTLDGLELDETVFVRYHEFANLLCSYRRAVSESPELAVICGSSGTGKTVMANRFGKWVSANGGLFLQGKFDLMQQIHPLSAVATALDNYCDALAKNEETEHAQMIASKLQDTLGSDLYYLIQVIPSIVKILGEKSRCETPRNSDHVVDAQQRLQYLICKLVEVIIVCSGSPVVLFLDDVQFANRLSISIIRQLLKASRSIQDGKQFYFLACCRDEDEIDGDHSFWGMIDGVSAFGFNKTLIQLNCMDKEMVTQVISSLLHLSPRLVGSLADIIYHKTKGNPLFLSRMLLSLNREGLLHLSLSKQRWTWDEEKIQTRKIPDDVAEFFAHNIKNLPVDIKIALGCLSCLGNSTDFEVLNLIEADLNIKLIEPLRLAVDEGHVSEVDGRFCFVHDRVQDTVYSMIGNEDRCLHHLNYGLALINPALSSGDISLLFVAATQMNLGGPIAVQEKEQYAMIANYNLTAGKKAMDCSDFISAFAYFDNGMSFLRKNHWRDHYDLSLELYNMASKCALSIQDTKSFRIICDQVLRNARTDDDTLFTSLLSMSEMAHSKVSDAIIYGADVLGRLGVAIPNAQSREDTLNLISQTHSMLKGISDDTLLNHHHTLSDYRVSMALKFLAKLEVLVQQVRPSLVPFVTIKIVELTIEHGLSPTAAIGFAWFGGMIMELGDLRGGHRFTVLAKNLLNKLQNSESAGEVVWVTTECLSFIEPYQVTRQYHIEGQTVSMAAGDIHWACFNKLMFTINLMWSGSNLSGVQEAFTNAGRFSEEHEHMSTSHYMKVFRRSISRLIGDEIESVTDNQFAQSTIQNKNPYQLTILYFHKMFVSFVLDNFTSMKQSAEKFFEYRMTSWHLLSGHAIHAFIGGLVSFRIFRETGDQVWANRGKHFKGRIASWKEQGSVWNFDHKHSVLEAEDQYCQNNFQNAQAMYANAIKTAQQHKFIHEEAICLELAANFNLAMGNHSIALDYFTQAHEKYIAWGAFSKVKALYAFIEDNFAGGQLPVPPNMERVGIDQNSSDFVGSTLTRKSS